MFCCVLLDWFGLNLTGDFESDIVSSWLDEIKLGGSYVRTLVVWFLLELQNPSAFA